MHNQSSSVINTFMLSLACRLFSFLEYDLRSGESCQNNVIMGICNSIVSVGFKAEETVVSRDAKSEFASLKCGDGVKRVLSAKLVRLSLI